MALPIIVYCLFNNLFMLEDALRFQGLGWHRHRRVRIREE